MRPRRHSASSQDSQTSGLLSIHSHGGATSGGSSSAAPTAGDKPHTLSQIAHRAVGDHHDKEESKHNRRRLFGDPSVVGGEHPGLERNDGSGRVSKGMPSTPWTNTKAKELRQEETGKTEESAEDKKKKQVAGEKMRHVMGVARDAGMNAEETHKDHDQRETKEDKDRKAIQHAIERLSLHTEGRLDHKTTEDPVPAHNSGSFQSSQARKDQEKFFHHDKATARQPDGEPASYPINGGKRPDHHQYQRAHEAGSGPNGVKQSSNGYENGGPEKMEDGDSQSVERSDSGDEDIERLPPRAPKENVNGDVPDAMAPTKDESLPGPRNDINLRPRIPDMQVILVLYSSKLLFEADAFFTVSHCQRIHRHPRQSASSSLAHCV